MLKDKDYQVGLFSSMVSETKQSKDKEILELSSRIRDFEHKLNVTSKENVLSISPRTSFSSATSSRTPRSPSTRSTPTSRGSRRRSPNLQSSRPSMRTSRLG